MYTWWHIFKSTVALHCIIVCIELSFLTQGLAFLTTSCSIGRCLPKSDQSMSFLQQDPCNTTIFCHTHHHLLPSKSFALQLYKTDRVWWLSNLSVGWKVIQHYYSVQHSALQMEAGCSNSPILSSCSPSVRFIGSSSCSPKSPLIPWSSLLLVPSAMLLSPSSLP